MNKLVLITIVTLGLSGLANAQTATDPKTASEIANQINVTQNTTALLLHKIATQSINPNVNLSDYKKFKREFQATIEATLGRYESNLRNDALKRVSILMDRYNAIYNSNEYSQEQKKSVLPQQLGMIKNQMPEISALYQKYLAEIYGAVGKISYMYNIGDPSRNELHCNVARHMRKEYRKYNVAFVLTDFRRSYLDGSHQSQTLCAPDIIKKGKRYIQYNDVFYPPEELIQSEKPFQDIKEYLFQTDTYPYLRSFCQSRLCISFVAADFSLFLSLVSSDIDKDLSFKLADGNEIKLSAKKLLKNNRVPFEQLEMTAYPKQDFESLPYDTAQ